MKLRSFVLATTALFAAATASFAALEAEAKPQVDWSVRLYPNQFQAGVAGDLLKSLGAIPLPEKILPDIQLPSVEKIEFAGMGGIGKPAPDSFFADIQIRPDKTSVDALVDSLKQKYQGIQEDIAGHPAVRFNVPLPPDSPAPSQNFWIARLTEDRFVVSPNRSIMEFALSRDPKDSSALGARRENELLGGLVAIDKLAKGTTDSDLLAMIQRLEFHLDSTADAFHLAASAALQDAKSAKRAARMIEGMITAMSLDEPSAKGPSLDERLKVTAKDSELNVDVSLDAKESRELIESLSEGLRDRQATGHHKRH